jgi:lysophospholipase L1-like esterase
MDRTDRPSYPSRRMRRLAPLVSMVLVLALAAPAQATLRPDIPARAIPLPNSIASIGDSITRAFDVCCFYGEYPEHSWTTGYDGADVVSSHYERILAQNPLIDGQYFNDAVTGAQMDDANGQAAQAVAQGPGYVTILMGANDLCTDSTATMTNPVDFQAQYLQTLATLEAGLPVGARIFVSSIPNVYQLWSVLQDDPSAEFVWYAAQICQSLLSPFNTERDRQKVVKRERTFNSILRSGCRQYTNCRFDNFAVYTVAFTADMVSTLDYFHPNLSGQAALADATWAASWWPTLDS